MQMLYHSLKYHRPELKDIVQISRESQQLDNIATVGPPAIEEETVEDADYDAEDEAQEAVPEDDENRPRLEDGQQLITKNDMWELMAEFGNFENERYQEDNVRPQVVRRGGGSCA
jgi:hypothetical protein